MQIAVNLKFDLDEKKNAGQIEGSGNLSLTCTMYYKWQIYYLYHQICYAQR